ncbi:hypothetical protein LNQ03_06475 [Klebsiella pneumoniae subsp. pneumoniae]|nr:hypothetical protein [Klebsiella pneumoniae subsp. pneumoniae]
MMNGKKIICPRLLKRGRLSGSSGQRRTLYYGWFPALTVLCDPIMLYAMPAQPIRLIEGAEATKQPSLRQGRSIGRLLTWSITLISVRTLADDGRQAAFLCDVENEIKLGGYMPSVFWRW